MAGRPTREAALARPAPGAASTLPANYAEILGELKAHVRRAQIKAATSVNQELIAAYLRIGQRLAEQDEVSGWGNKVVEQLAKDLRDAFPAMSGFSRTNVFYMRQVHLAWAHAAGSIQQLVGLIPWGHHLVLLTKVKDHAARAFYLEQTIAQGWSRAVLTAQIEARLHTRQGKALTNFDRTLPAPHSDLAQQTLKDPYVFDFLTLGPERPGAGPRARRCSQHVRDFLLELGVGFAFVGSQVQLEVGGEDFYIDLLFYHLKLRCFVVIDLKTGGVQARVRRQDELLPVGRGRTDPRHPEDKPSIGLVLCKEKNQVVVEYALRDIKKPIGVAAWETRLVKRCRRRSRAACRPSKSWRRSWPRAERPAGERRESSSRALADDRTRLLSLRRGGDILSSRHEVDAPPCCPRATLSRRREGLMEYRDEQEALRARNREPRGGSRRDEEEGPPREARWREADRRGARRGGRRAQVAPRGLPGRPRAAAHGPRASLMGLAARLVHGLLEPLRRPEDGLGARRRDHGVHHELGDLQGAPARPRQRAVDPREQLHAVDGLGGGVLDGLDAGLGLQRLPDDHARAPALAGRRMGLVFSLAMLGVFMAIPMKRNMVNIEQLPFPSGTAAAETLRSLYTAGRRGDEEGAEPLRQHGARRGRRVPRATGWPTSPSASSGGRGPSRSRSRASSRVSAWLTKLGAGRAAVVFDPKGYTFSFEALDDPRGGRRDHGHPRRDLDAGRRGPLLRRARARSCTTMPAGEGHTVINVLGYRGIVSWSVWGGVALMTTAALLNFGLQWRTLARALSGIGAMFQKKDDLRSRTTRSSGSRCPPRGSSIGTLVSGALCVAINYYAFHIAIWLGALAVLISAVLAIVACRATGETDTTPIGALGKITQLTYGLLIPQNITANLMTANVTSSIASSSADLLTDLKSGYLLGANPRKQFLAQFFGVFAGTLVAVPGFYLLVPRADVLGGDKFPAPAAQVWKAVAELLGKGVHSLHPSALCAMAVGGALGIVITLLEKAFPKHRHLIPSPTGIGLAFVIPAWNSMSMFLGALIAWVLEKKRPATAETYTIPVASGFIAGESLMGVLVAVFGVRLRPRAQVMRAGALRPECEGRYPGGREV